MRSLFGFLTSLVGLGVILFFLAIFGLFAFRQAVVVPQPRIVHLASPVGHGQMEMVEMPGRTMASGDDFTSYGRLLLLGVIALFAVLTLAAIVLMVRAASGPAPASDGGPSVFDLAWQIHRKLDSFEARVERLESRLLARYDDPAGHSERGMK